ncbi:DUF2007 domain-containing protein [Vibrio aestuarianus]|uniref:DUF2007 domain-containing protein n=1 Tax=Vibrio aestuarianus TaxID=28171 RepID=A0ABD7YNX7_9VIBR|nr:DUF2007 domain-containing protein [Vibrio aestuarianus]MDE1231714.1 DUF2007 domain-containing protein [Vibrio aestuarianus]WGK86777.1 DUF2007 domain-containing protein [Vibrio aestuarianus]CAH8188876.1 Phosphoenolpyruvate synthase [Vibrio aestuarianus]CAH8210736.1 conserved hypothetical protein [Vibrio aestuarianus]
MVIVSKYSFTHEAYIAKAKLHSFGIDCHLTDEHTINSQWLYSDAIGGVKLWVFEQDFDKANTILTHDYSNDVDAVFSDNSGNDNVSCNDCNSNEIVIFTKGKSLAFAIFILIGFPLFPFKHGYKCKNCNKFFIHR